MAQRTAKDATALHSTAALRYFSVVFYVMSIKFTAVVRGHLSW